MNPLTLLVAIVTLLALPVDARRKPRQQPQLSRYTSEEDPFSRTESLAHRMEQPYLDKNYQSRYYDYGGSTFIRGDKYIRLTADLPDKRGWLMSKVPSMPENFQVEFEFRIDGQGSSIYGDGMAFWLLNERVTDEGPVFGLRDKFKGTAIFFDTYKNNGPGKIFPYVVLMRGDGEVAYDQAHDGAANELAGCSARGLHNSREGNRARITYVKDKFLSLELDYKGKGRFEKCFEANGVDVSQPAFLGFSAQTGELSEYHDIYKINVFSLNNPPSTFAEVDYYMNGNKNAPIHEAYSSSSGSSESSPGSWGYFFLKFFLFIFTLVGGYIGFTLYRAKQRRNRDAFYL